MATDEKAPSTTPGVVKTSVKGFKSLQAFITKFNNDWVLSLASGLAFNLMVAIIPIHHSHHCTSRIHLRWPESRDPGRAYSTHSTYIPATNTITRDCWAGPECTEQGCWCSGNNRHRHGYHWRFRPLCCDGGTI